MVVIYLSSPTRSWMVKCSLTLFGSILSKVTKMWWFTLCSGSHRGSCKDQYPYLSKRLVEVVVVFQVLQSPKGRHSPGKAALLTGGSFLIYPNQVVSNLVCYQRCSLTQLQYAYHYLLFIGSITHAQDGVYLVLVGRYIVRLCFMSPPMLPPLLCQIGSRNGEQRETLISVNKSPLVEIEGYILV